MKATIICWNCLFLNNKINTSNDDNKPTGNKVKTNDTQI